MLSDLINALAATGYQFAHYGWSHAPTGDYGVYAEESGDDFIADCVHAEKGTVCYINYFTRDDSGTPKTTIENALNGLSIPWSLNTIQYEEETGYIHYEWECSVYG